MENKLRHINKKALAAFTLACGLAYYGHTINHKKAKDNQKPTKQNESEVTAEQAFFDKVNEVNTKKTTLNVNLGPAVIINPDSTTEYGSFTDVNIVIPIGKKSEGKWAVMTDIEDAMTQDNSYSNFGVDNTTHRLVAGIGLQKNLKNDNYLNCTLVGGLQHQINNSIINQNDGYALKHEKIWDTPFGVKATWGQTRKSSTSGVTAGVLYNPKGKEIYPSLYLVGGRRLKNDSTFNVGMKFSTKIKLGDQEIIY